MTVERAARNMGWVFGLYLVRRVIRLAYMPVFARLLQEQGFGAYYLLLTTVGLLTVASTLGLPLLLMRRINSGEADPGALMSRCTGLNLVVTLLFYAGLCVVTPFTGYSDEVRTGLFVMGLALVPMGFITVMHSAGAAYERLWIFGILDNTAPLVEAAAGVVLLFAGYGLVTLCVLHLVVYTLYAVVFFLLTRRHVLHFGIAFDLRAWVQYLKASWQVGVYAILNILYRQLGVIVLSAVSGNAKVGYFAAAMVFIEILHAGSNAFRSAVFPYMVRAWNRSADELKGFHLSCLRLAAVMTVPVGLATYLAAPALINLLFGDRYASSIPVLQVLSWLVFPIMMTAVMERVCYAADHQVLPTVASAATNVVGITLSVVLVIAAEGRAAESLAWAMLLSGLVGFCVYTGLVQRYIYGFNWLGPLARTAAASVVPVTLMLLLDGHLNAFVLLVPILATFAAGVFVFRVFSAREFEIIRRAVRPFLRPRRETVDVDDAPQP